MIGVPLGIVDKQKVQQLVEKLFAAEDTGAEFELDVNASAGGGFIVKMEIKARVAPSFAAALLAGNNIDLYGSKLNLAHPAPASNATPPSTTPPPKASSKK